MGRNEVANVVNELVGTGMELKQAMEFASVAAKFVVGQGSNGVDTAKMIQALQSNANITDPKVLEKALEAVAFQGLAVGMGDDKITLKGSIFPGHRGGLKQLDTLRSIGGLSVPPGLTTGYGYDLNQPRAGHRAGAVSRRCADRAAGLALARPCSSEAEF